MTSHLNSLVIDSPPAVHSEDVLSSASAVSLVPRYLCASSATAVVWETFLRGPAACPETLLLRLALLLVYNVLLGPHSLFTSTETIASSRSWLPACVLMRRPILGVVTCRTSPLP